MRVCGKWLVVATVNGKKRIASSFNTKKEAKEALNLYFTPLNDDEWKDSMGTVFTIEKSTH